MQGKPEHVFDVTYQYNYNGEKFPRHEHMTKREIENIQRLIAKGVNEFGSHYSDLVIGQDYGPRDTTHLETWLKIGKKNLWIREANDPPFTIKCFSECKTVDHLIEKLRHGNWCLAQAFYHKDMCFINQVDGGDEWLVIRRGIDFESWSCGSVIRNNEAKFRDQLNRMFAATDEQLRSLEYMKAGPTDKCVHCERTVYPGSSTIYDVDRCTCDDCWVSKKLYMPPIITKAKAGVRLTKEDLKHVHYKDHFYAAGAGLEDNRGLIHWDDEIAIGHPYTINAEDHVTIYKPVAGTGNPVMWELVDEYKAEQEGTNNDGKIQDAQGL